MKKHLTIILLNFILIQGVYSQTDQKQNSQLIADIEKKKDEIKNNLGDFQKIEEVNDSISYRYVYKKGKELKLIAIDYKDRRDPGKYIDKRVDSYFSNGQLIYSEQIWTDIPTNKIVDDEKFYLNDLHLISWIKFENKAVDNTSQEFKDVGTELTAYGMKMLNVETK